MDLEMVWGNDGNELRLQAIEHKQSPVNRHPVTGRPVWFCNMHNHARFLRDRRPCSVPEVGMTDVYFGDLSPIPGEMLNKINEVCDKKAFFQSLPKCRTPTFAICPKFNSTRCARRTLSPCR